MQARGKTSGRADGAQNLGFDKIFYRRKTLAPETAIAGPILIGVMAMISAKFGAFTLALITRHHQRGWLLLTLIFFAIAFGSAILVFVCMRAMVRAYGRRGNMLIGVDQNGVTLDRANGTFGIPWGNIAGAVLQQLPHGGVFLRVRVRGDGAWGKGVTAAGVPLNLVQLDGAPDDVVRAIVGHRRFEA